MKVMVLPLVSLGIALELMGSQAIAALPIKVFSQTVDANPESRELVAAVDSSESPFLLPNPAAFIPSFPSFNSQRLDQQIRLYANYLATSGPPDVLIVGSSRSLQGVDPTALEQALAAQGHSRLKIYNFGVNGATAQVVELVLRRILTPDQLPKLILWADGSRAFNSGRVDVTFNGIAASEGYKRLLTGGRPIRLPVQVQGQLWVPEVCIELPTGDQLNGMSGSSCYLSPQTSEPATTPRVSSASSSQRQTVADLDAAGFQPVATQFDPATYYRQFPRVAGQYDTNYIPFRLDGEQTRAAIAVASFARARQIPLVFVNLPLTGEYLDPVRRDYEQQFKQHMQQLSAREGFVFRDLVQRWPSQNHYFADPSHLNHEGARAVALELAADAAIPWPRSQTAPLEGISDE